MHREPKTNAAASAPTGKGIFSIPPVGRPLLPLAKCRAILGADSPDDAVLSQLREQLYGLAHVVLEAFSGERREKHSPCSPNEARRVCNGAVKGKTGPVNFSEALASLPEDECYELVERAAIHEFEGGLDRRAAELRAFSDHWRAKTRERKFCKRYKKGGGK